jgi:malonyl-CoA O-methyltransferase
MGSNKNAIQCQFNRSAAGSYDIHAHVQRSMADQVAKSLIGWKNEVRSAAPLQILEIGCGTGTLTEILLNEWPSASITALDIAPAMIKAAENRILSKSANHAGYSNNQPTRVRFLQADIEMWATEALMNSFDLIVSNACFQWLSNPRQTLIQLRRILHAEGLLVFTSFGPETFYELHEAFNEAYRVNGMEPQRHGLSFQSTAGWNDLLKEAGFSNIHYESSIQTERYASAKEFLHSVKAMGASTSEANAISGLSLRRLFAEMYREYEDKFSLQDGVAATYDLQLFQAAVSH